MSAVHRQDLPNGRLHLSHGPIDLVIGATGEGRSEAFDAAHVRLGTVLQELMDEIDLLRRSKGPRPHGEIARHMWYAARAHSGFVTPMAAVAGAVAQGILKAMQKAAPLQRAYVNNGGDIALHLTGGASFDIALAGLDGRALGKAQITQDDQVRGVATSGRGGRSLSLGIADSVTVLAQNAAQADVAATLIANAVDLPGHGAVHRARADSLREGSDLGARLAVQHVDELREESKQRALARGASRARAMQRAGLIEQAHLHLQGCALTVERDNEKELAHA